MLEPSLEAMFPTEKRGPEIDRTLIGSQFIL